MDYTARGILQVRILEWVAFPFSRGSSQPRIEPRSLALQADPLHGEPQRQSREWLVETKELSVLVASEGPSLTG